MDLHSGNVLLKSILNLSFTECKLCGWCMEIIYSAMKWISELSCRAFWIQVMTIQKASFRRSVVLGSQQLQCTKISKLPHNVQKDLSKLKHQKHQNSISNESHQAPLGFNEQKVYTYHHQVIQILSFFNWNLIDNMKAV